MKASRQDLHQFEYGVGLASLVILVAGLNILDAIFTQVILATGGAECNHVVRAAIDIYGDRLWIWKVAAVSSLLILMCLYSRLRLFRVQEGVQKSVEAARAFIAATVELQAELARAGQDVMPLFSRQFADAIEQVARVASSTTAGVTPIAAAREEETAAHRARRAA